MKTKEIPVRYGTGAIILHWTVFLLFVNQFVSAALMIWMGNDATVAGASRSEIFGWHKAIGLLVLMIVFVRLIWRKTTTLPEWAPGIKEWEKSSIHFIERGLYVLMFVMPLSGLLMSVSGGRGVLFFNLFEIQGLSQPNTVLSSIGWFLHRTTSYAIIGMVALHVAFVLRRHIFEKDGYLNRMLPFVKT